MPSKVARRISCSLLVAVLAGAGGTASAFAVQDGRAALTGQRQATSQAGAAKPPRAGRSQFTTRLVGDLKKSDFRVKRGSPMLYPRTATVKPPFTPSLDACTNYTYALLGSCFGNNPAAPYVMPVVKSWPGEYVDPATVNAWGPTRPGFSATYRLHGREGIVMYGKMPPPGKYMGLQTLAFSKQGLWKAKDFDRWAYTPNLPWPMPYLFGTVPPNDPKSRRVRSMSALGDIVNNVAMERRSGYPFRKKRYFIITPSATTDHAVRSALHRQGISDRHIFTEEIPRKDRFGPIGPLGMGKKAIDFATFFRYAIPDPGYEDAAAQWRRNPPLTVLRLRTPSSLGPVHRYGSLRFGRQTARSESYLAGALQTLVQAVCARTTSTLNVETTACDPQPPASSFMSDPAHDYGWTGPYCRAIGMDCLGDQRDAGYFFSAPLPVDAGQIYAVVSTLATKTDNATYAALSVNDASIMAGVANVLDVNLEGSADGYATTVDDTGKFFVHYLTRDCAALKDLPGWPKNCTEITSDMVPTSGSTTALGDPALFDKLIVGIRDYIRPGTRRGPDSTKLLRPRVLTFTQP